MVDTSEHEEQPGQGRAHFEGLGHQWAVLVGNPAALMPQIVGTVIHSGGTRECWQRKDTGRETVLMAWPQDEPLRAAVILQGQEAGDLKPVSAMPLLEGLPNDLMVEEARPWASQAEANVAVSMIEGRNPMWFYDPLYFRDKEDLTPGVSHTFLMAGLALGLRKALLDEMTITQGPVYESHAEAWMEAHPGASRLDVPVLKVKLAGRQIIMPGRNFCEYEIRNTIREVQHTKLDKAPVYMLRMAFPFEDRPPLELMIYAPAHLFGDYEPKEGDEVDAYIWLQGRVADM